MPPSFAWMVARSHSLGTFRQNRPVVRRPGSIIAAGTCATAAFSAGPLARPPASSPACSAPKVPPHDQSSPALAVSARMPSSAASAIAHTCTRACTHEWSRRACLFLLQVLFRSLSLVHAKVQVLLRPRKYERTLHSQPPQQIGTEAVPSGSSFRRHDAGIQALELSPKPILVFEDASHTPSRRESIR
jgi:hypothetical protein